MAESCVFLASNSASNPRSLASLTLIHEVSWGRRNDKVQLCRKNLRIATPVRGQRKLRES